MHPRMTGTHNYYKMTGVVINMQNSLLQYFEPFILTGFYNSEP